MEGIRHTWRRMPGRSRLLALALPVVLVAGAAGAAVSAVTLTPRPTSTDAPQASAPPIAAATPLPLRSVRLMPAHIFTRAERRPVRVTRTHADPGTRRRRPAPRHRRPADRAPPRLRLPTGPPREPDGCDHGRVGRPVDRAGGRLLDPSRYRRLPATEWRRVPGQGERPVPGPPEPNGQRRRRAQRGGLEGVRDRDRRLRLHRLRRRQGPGAGRRRRRRDARPALLRPRVLGDGHAPRLGPAGRPQPPRAERCADLRPEPEGRQ